MDSRTLIVLAILTSLIGYLEWGGGNQLFLFQAELEVIQRLFVDPTSVMHPFVVLPLFGHVLLLAALFQRQPGALLTIAGLAAVGLLLGFMFVIGVMTVNLKVLASTVPFLVTAILTIRRVRRPL